MVPLTIPSTLLSRSPASDSESGRMIGMPPPTAASNRRETPISAAVSINSTPLAATNSLFAVTTGLACRKRAQHQLATRFEPTHQLDHQLDRGVVHQFLGTVGQQCGRKPGRRGACRGSRTATPEQFEVDAGLGGDRRAVVEQLPRQSAADVSSAENADTDTHRSKR